MLGFGDESGTFDRQYQSVSVVSGSSSVMLDLRGELKEALSREHVKEVKFQKVGTHAPLLNAAHAFLLLAVTFAAVRSIRVDTVVWDTHDSRHAVQRRDDVANLERMYYRVVVCAARQWGAEGWSLRPDAGSQVNWAEMREVLRKTRMSRKSDAIPLWDDMGGGLKIVVESIEPTDSESEALVQLADLMAGLARFSCEERNACVGWLANWGRRREGQMGLDWDAGVDEETAARKNRFRLVGALHAACGKKKLGVSLSARQCLWTPRATNPINFWHYAPQGANDRAPTR
jgi:hypothetical protein